MSESREPLRAWVDSMEQLGYSVDEVRPRLRQAGWAEEQITEALGPPPAAPPAPPPGAVTAPALPETGGRGLALAALILGLVALFLLPLAILAAPVAIVLALVSLSRRQPGQTLALVGLALAGIALLLWPLATAILVPVVLHARDRALPGRGGPTRVLPPDETGGGEGTEPESGGAERDASSGPPGDQRGQEICLRRLPPLRLGFARAVLAAGVGGEVRPPGLGLTTPATRRPPPSPPPGAARSPNATQSSPRWPGAERGAGRIPAGRCPRRGPGAAA